MSPELTAVLMFSGVLVGIIFLGFPVAFVMGGLALIFGLIGFGDTIFPMFVVRILGTMKEYVLLAVPLFVLMGAMMERSGIADRLFRAMYIWLGGLRGGLAIAIIIIGTVFAAATGVIGAAVVTMGLLALPPMLQRGYDKGLATGAVCAGGTLGILIPPSLMLVLMAPLAGLSLGKLYMAAFFPGFLLSGLYIAYIAIRCGFRPHLGPPMPKEERAMPTGRKLWLLLTAVIPPIGLVFAALGTIFLGIASVTEAAAMAAFLSLLLPFMYRTFSYKVVRDAVYMTLKTTSMVLLVVVGAGFFSAVFLGLGGADVARDLILGLSLGKWGVIAVMMFIIFILGALIDWIGILYITIPIFMPIAKALGLDPIWFATLIAVNLQMSFLTPPFAFAIFYLKGIAPPEVRTSDIIRGVVPYIGLQAIGLLLVILFPQIALWLPGKMIR